ncbi:MAG: hypothetical protein J1F31_01915 [Erysipelotrichales bacterium]|nr:hypothetical protein [Erysipelotrichales bacterium]
MENDYEQKKNLIKALNKVIEDIMDNYDEYNYNEKLEIENFYRHAISLNDKLEHYDQKKNILGKSKEAFSNFFGGNKK